MAIVPALTAMALLPMATGITATGVVLSRTRIVCGSAADVGGKQWIGRIAVAMSAVAAAVDTKSRDSSIPQAVKKVGICAGLLCAHTSTKRSLV
jgi:hypothetical protein